MCYALKAAEGGSSKQHILEVHNDVTTKGDVKLTNTNEVTNATPIETTPFNYVSLFSGIGGFEQALNNLGGSCVLSSEIDKFANQSYEALYGHPTAGDIMAIDAKDVPDHDVLVGGFPCQSFSVAGKRGGFEDARGTLFFEVARLAAEKQPKVVLLENVKGLVGHDKGKTLDTIVKTLNDIGYTVDFEVLNSKFFGVPQNRERIFIIGVRDDLVDSVPWAIEGNTVVPKGKRRIADYGVESFNFDWPKNDTVTTRLRDVLEAQVDEKYYLSDDKTAKLVAQLDGSVRMDFPAVGVGKDGESRAIIGSTPRMNLPQHINKSQSTMIFGDPQMLGHVELNGHDAIKRVYSTESVRPTLTTMGGGHREPKIAEPQVIAEGDDLSYCLDANYTKGLAPSGLNKGRRTHVGEDVKPRYRIRKLTPLECWRLQGFSDEEHQTVVDAGLSDSQRYKQAGNAVTVNVIKAIGERLLPYLTT
ncbi:DNA (cytosine-5-)-methyltransferase [Sporosarcina sp. E16_3]|nr:DNA (cytosine-5-)-methyltransferase [Sporosarcina sp. E16_3]